MASFAARNARVRVNGVFYRARRWMVNLRADEIDVTTFEDGGYYNFLTGPLQAEITVEGFFQDDASPFTVYAVFPTQTITNLTLFLNNLPPGGIVNNANQPATFFNFPTCVVLTSDTEADVKGALGYNFTARNKGPFATP